MTNSNTSKEIDEILSRNFYWKLNADGEKIVHLDQESAKTAIQQVIDSSVNRSRGSAVKDFMTEVWGERCKTKDTEDFPELLHSNGRCPSCAQWEIYDSWLNDQLTEANSIQEDK